MYIQMKDVVKKYGEGENTIFALDHASLELEKGEMCVILGPSGSGKSTLLNMLGGLDSADDGTIIVDGCDLSSISKKELREYRRDKVGIVFQTYNLIGELTVRENIKVVRDISAAPLSIEELLKDLGLERHAAHFPEQPAAALRHRPRADKESRDTALRRAYGRAGFKDLAGRSSASPENKRQVSHDHSADYPQ